MWSSSVKIRVNCILVQWIDIALPLEGWLRQVAGLTEQRAWILMATGGQKMRCWASAEWVVGTETPPHKARDLKELHPQWKGNLPTRTGRPKGNLTISPGLWGGKKLAILRLCIRESSITSVWGSNIHLPSGPESPKVRIQPKKIILSKWYLLGTWQKQIKDIKIYP